MQGTPVFPLLRLALHLCVGLMKCALLFPFLDHDGKERRIQRWSAQLISICGISLQLNQTAQAKPASPALIICNHISWLDIFVINSVHACRFVAKSDIRDWPLIGWLCEKSGTIFIARGKQRDVRRIYAGLVQSIHNGERVAFFPEGTTAPQGIVLPFHANLFEAAIEAQVPVQAYALRYVDEAGHLHPAADFIGDMSFMQSVMMILRHRGMQAQLIRLPAMSSAGAHRRELAVAMHDKIAQVLNPAADTADRPLAVNHDQTVAAL